METKHTKGRWVIHGDFIMSETRYPNSRTIESSIPVVKLHYNGDPEEYEANAMVVAAAPGMLNTLIDQRQRLMEMLADEINPVTDAAVRLQLHHMVARMTVAIRNATA